MDKMQKTIKLVLDNTGAIKTPVKDFNLYQGEVGATGLEIFVPRSMLNAPAAATDDTILATNMVTIYAVQCNERGVQIPTAAEQCVFSHTVEIDNVEYWVFKRITGLPASFTRYAGELKICASVFRAYTDESQIDLQIEGRSKMQMFKTEVLPNPDGNIDPDYAPSELAAVYGLINSTLSTMQGVYGELGKGGTTLATPPVNLTTLFQEKADRVESMLKYDLRQPLTVSYLDYRADDYKTLGAAFYHAVYDVPNPDGEVSSREGVVIAVSYRDHETNPDLMYQDEVFVGSDTVVHRTLTLDKTNHYTHIDGGVGEWGNVNIEWLQSALAVAATKIPRVMDATPDNFPAFDDDGNVKDSGVSVQLIAKHTSQIAALQGRGGALHYIVSDDIESPYFVDFDPDDVTDYYTQQSLTYYACTQIWGAGELCIDPETPQQDGDTTPLGTLYWHSTESDEVHTVNEMFNSTWVRNDTNKHRYVLTNTPDTDPAVFEWGDVGIDTTATATNTTQGVVKGVADDGSHDYMGRVNAAGEVEINLSAEKKAAIESGATAEKVNAYYAHLENKENPHEVTKAQVGLDQVDNTSDLDKPISTATQAALDLKANQEQVDALQDAFDNFQLDWTE